VDDDDGEGEALVSQEVVSVYHLIHAKVHKVLHEFYDDDQVHVGVDHKVEEAFERDLLEEGENPDKVEELLKVP